MLERLRQIIAPPATPGREVQHTFEERQLAAAALMVEAARLDDDFDASERARIEHLVQTRFGLSGEEARVLVEEGERTSAESVEWHGFTQAIKEGFGYDERVQLIEMLWEVVYADGELHDYESNLLRRVTGLLYVTDRDSGEARKRVLDRLGLA